MFSWVWLKATTALNFFGISDQIDYIVEDNELKDKKFSLGLKYQSTSKIKLIVNYQL